jgi:ligand-binding sensor domain-containing protein
MAMIFIIHCLALASAAQPVYQFENLTEANGLSDNRVTCFFKDKKGFMWIGTENGLNRFDGHSFLIYQPGKPASSISNSFINDIEQDGSGRLWVATTKGLNRIDTEKDTTIVFFSDKTDRMPSDLIWDTYIDRQDRVWLAPDNRDLCYYDIKKDSFTHIPWRAFVTRVFPDRQNKYKSIRKIYYKSDDELWLGTAAGLFSYCISTGQFTYHKSFETDHFIQLEISPDNKTVYFTQNPVPALEILNLESDSKKDISWKDIPANTPAYQRNSNCSNYRWLPAGKHIAEINTITGETLLIGHRADDPYSLPNGIVRAIYRENTGLVWVATSNGIGKFNPAMNPFPFTEVFPSSQAKESEENDLFRYDHPVHTVFYSEQDNKYYIGSPATNSLIIKDRATGQTETISSIQGIPLRSCSVIFEDSRGMLWILAGTNAFCYDRASRRFSVSPFRSAKRNVLFADMAEDHDGNLWFACYNDGLYRYDIKNGNTRKFDEQNGFTKLPTSLYFDREQNKLLIGTFSIGARAYDLRQQRFSRIIKNTDAPDHSPFSLVTDIVKDKNGILWVAGYANGIARVSAYEDSGKMQVKLITTRNGLPENNIYALQPDLKGNVWASSFGGITQIAPDGRIIENYNRRKGLNFSDFYSPFSITKQGEILTGIGNGFIRFLPDSLPYTSPDFPVVLTAVRPKDPKETNSLSFANNEIQFEFAALSYVNPSQTSYEYQLVGADNGWVKAGTASTVRYNNLSPGSYLFKVRAIDFTGKPSSNTAGFAFTIRPPWWQTWWFRLSATLAVAGMIYFLFRRRIQLVKNKASIRQQMTELKGQALRAQMNPHFIFNCLNAIQELIVREQYTASYNYLSKFSKLLRMVLAMSEKNLIPLNNEIAMCMLYLELESMRFKNSFGYTIQVDPEIDTDTVFIPTLLMQPFIENAIWHGLMQKEGEKKLSIHFTEQNGRLICTISDNGIGRKRSAEIKAQKIGSRHFDSKGMELAKQRIENLHADGAHDTAIEITDCTDEQGNATGTIVRITISSPENNQA